MRAATLCLTLLLACLFAATPAHALQQTLVASDGQEDDYFGADVAVDGDTAVVGATTNFQSAGYVYVFTRDGDTWTQTARLQGSDTESGDQFGVNVAIEGDTIVVGAPKHPNGTRPAGRRRLHVRPHGRRRTGRRRPSSPSRHRRRRARSSAARWPSTAA